jgi:hypothetical protein
MMADDLAKPPWKLNAHDAKRMPAPKVSIHAL